MALCGNKAWYNNPGSTAQNHISDSSTELDYTMKTKNGHDL